MKPPKNLPTIKVDKKSATPYGNFQGILITETYDFNHIQILRIREEECYVLFYIPFPAILDYNHSREKKRTFLYEIAYQFMTIPEEIAFSEKLEQHLNSLPSGE